MRTNERPCLGNFFDICFFFFLPCSSPFSREITVLPYTLLLVSRGFSYRQTKCLLVREQRCSKPPPQARAGASVRERCFIVHTVSLQFLFYYFSRWWDRKIRKYVRGWKVSKYPKRTWQKPCVPTKQKTGFLPPSTVSGIHLDCDHNSRQKLRFHFRLSCYSAGNDFRFCYNDD